MTDWAIIYHDGTTLSIVKSSEMNWNDAPTNNVQIILFKISETHWHAVKGMDEYTLAGCPGSETKFGLLITDEQWKDVRNAMVGMAWR